MSFLEHIGALAGLAAFFGLAVLALLYFSQARDVRRLRQNASFLVERPDETAAPTRAAAGATAPPVAAPAGPSAPPQSAAEAPVATRTADAQAFREAELTRQAAERRQRFEQRRQGGYDGSNGARRFPPLPEPRALAVIVVGALLLVAGAAFAISQLAGGGTENGGGQRAGASNVRVMVLNSTAKSGLAGAYASRLNHRGFKNAHPGNTDLPFTQSEVMWNNRRYLAAARAVADAAQIRKIGPLDDAVRPDATDAPVVVVLGSDKASGA